MATIALNANKINQMPGLINEVRTAVIDYRKELFALKTKVLPINKDVCDMDDVISSIQSSTQTQEQKINELATFIKNTEEFIAEVVRIDSEVAEVITQRKEEFYEEYYYLKPDSEKNNWEKFCDKYKKVGEWCKEHWKIIATTMLVVVSVAIIICTAGTALSLLSSLLLMAAKGTIMGTIIGGLAGGTISAVFGGSFFEGFEDGAFGGAISGAITGGMSSWMGVGTASISLGKLMLIGATAETSASLLGDIGDIAIQGKKLSFGEVIFNAGFSFVLGGLSGRIGYWLGNNLPKICIPGINQGNGSWAHVWATQSARSLRQGSIINVKTILKGIGSKVVDEVWDYCLEPFKSIAGEWKESWNLFPQK